MSGDDQERFKDYLELELFIAELQAGYMTHPPHEMTPEQARIYRMALLFHAATPEVSDPSPKFAANLQARLERELKEVQQKPFVPEKKRVSRRKLLAGGAAAAASVAIGAGIDRAIDQDGVQPSSADAANPQPTSWFYVTTVAELGNQAVQFKTKSLIGYVLRSAKKDGSASAEQIIALSAACTHMGCIVQWAGSDRKFHCPCHGGTFDATGGPDGELSNYLKALPALEVEVVDGNIYVRVPAGV